MVAALVQEVVAEEDQSGRLELEEVEVEAWVRLEGELFEVLVAEGEGEQQE